MLDLFTPYQEFTLARASDGGLARLYTHDSGGISRPAM
jgi:hypothetical protein